MTRRALCLGLLCAAIATGCRGGPSDELPSQASGPKPIVFEGLTDPKYVGHWKSVDGIYTMDIHGDGSLSIETVTRSVKGVSDDHLGGMWKAAGSDLLVQYRDKSRTLITLKYAANLKDDTLTLSQMKGRIKTVYKRKKK